MYIFMYTIYSVRTCSVGPGRMIAIPRLCCRGQRTTVFNQPLPYSSERTQTILNCEGIIKILYYAITIGMCVIDHAKNTPAIQAIAAPSGNIFGITVSTCHKYHIVSVIRDPVHVY